VADTPMTGRKRALWIAVSLLVAIVLSIATIWVARRAVGADADQLAERAVEMAMAQRPSSSGASDEQVRQQMMPFMRAMISLYPVTVPIGVLVSTVVIGSILMGMYRVAGVPVRWPQTFAATAAGSAASAVARFCVTLIVVFIIKQSIPAESLLDNSIVPLNVAAFLPSDMSAVWRSAASKLDLLLVVFVIALVSYLIDEEGFSHHAGKIIGATVACWVLWIVLGMLWTAAWSGFGVR
jgi:hypothetical protein